MPFLINLLQFIYWALTVYILVVLAAAVVSWVNPDPGNALVQFLNRATQPAFSKVRQYFPTWFGGVDIAPIILIFIIAFIQQVVIASAMLILAGAGPVIIAVKFIEFVSGVLTTYMWIVIAAAVVSWVSADLNNPIVRGLFALTEPVLYRIRRLIPLDLGGIDLSPVVLIAAIMFVQYVLLSGLASMLLGGPVMS